MFTGYIKGVNESDYTELPKPLRWEIVRADKPQYDSFTYVFPFDGAFRERLSGIPSFQAKDGQTLLFTGRVDGFTVGLDASGCVCTLYGRSTGALMVDNELPAAELTAPTVQTIQQKYLAPLGILIERETEPTPPDTFKILLGDSVLKVLANYAMAVEALPCRILTNGNLRLAYTRTDSGITLERGDVFSAELLDRRRGVVSEFRLLEDYGYEPRHNTAFLTEGGRARRYMRQCVYSETQIIYETMRKRRLYRVLLPGMARIEPASQFTLTLPELGVDTTLYVTECRSVGSPEGILCEITGAEY